MSESAKAPQKIIKRISEATIRFAGDSGDGMQLTGTQFTDTTAIVGNDLATLPDYPAEIRAPAGSLAGVSSFQIQFSDHDIQTPGDQPDVLVIMNPAALQVHLQDLKPNGIIIANTATFTKRNLQLANWRTNPLEDETLRDYTVYAVDMSKLVENALESLGLSSKVMARSNNMFALGLLYWMFDRPLETSIKYMEKKFKSRPEIVEANKRALTAGYNYGETTEIFTTTYSVAKAALEPGEYRNVVGNQAVALGLVVAAQRAGLKLFYAGYPITPASDILHALSTYKNYDVITFQAEDEIAAVSAAIGSSFAGALAVTGTSGPGMALKGEAIGLAVSTELPLVVINVQRAGPSTGMPTRTEQSDLFQAMYGRNSEAPLVVLAATTPSDCFLITYEACRIATKFMIPVIILTDGYLANGAEPWLIPELDDLPPMESSFLTANDNEFHPFEILDEKRMARPWVIPGTPHLEHRIGGLEKDFLTGDVSYDPHNHERMVRRRQAKVDVVANDIPEAQVFGSETGDLLVVGWGSTFGAIRSAVERIQKQGLAVSHLQLRYLNPFPRNLGEVMLKFPKILIPELNMGQLSKMIRSEFLVDAIPMNKMQGRPFTASEIVQEITSILTEMKDAS